jgi:predicted TIM-barrel fold metal-dependent hydrolase
VTTDRVIDAHQHIWDLTRAEYPWLGDDRAAVNRTVSFEEVEPQLAPRGWRLSGPTRWWWGSAT